MPAKSKSNEINIIRIYEAPVKAVWDAWTDPKQAAKWWGPRGFTITTHSKDLRVGGTWDYTMHGPDGVDYPNTTKYFEVETYKKLVYDHGGYKDRPPLFRVTVLFSEEKGNKTKMDMTMAFATPEVAAESRKFIKAAGGNATWDRLAEYVEKEKTSREIFVINRSFNTPLKTMFAMWTDPKHVEQWMPPTGMQMKFLEADIRPGGKTKYVMTGNGITMYGRAEYLKIENPSLIVYTQQFCDEKGNVSRHPFAPLWPETMLTTVQLSEESPEETRVTLTWEAYGSFTAAELAEFVKEKPGMTMGWTGSMDKLEAHLEKK
ncbi:MAG: hypothetical protein B7Y39_12855 [Bdellovibrio sp. 28-41-41]|nr:MAG: hypothetical protein B7Y39_12855 [Bdellovibrio sp. 28-41-41]